MHESPSDVDCARYQLTFLVEWDDVERIRESVDMAVRAVYGDPDLSARIAIATAELLGNAVEHGDCSVHSIHYELRLGPEAPQIRVGNGYGDELTADELKRRIAWTRGFVDPYECYVALLTEIAEKDEPQDGGLGLARVVYEGGCDLSCVVDVATRYIEVRADLRPSRSESTDPVAL